MASSVIKNSAFIVREKDITYSVGANSSYNANLKTLIDSDMPSGYMFAGLAGYASNSIQVLTTNYGYYDSNYSLQLANRGNTALSNQMFRIFYLAMPI